MAKLLLCNAVESDFNERAKYLYASEGF